MNYKIWLQLLLPFLTLIFFIQLIKHKNRTHKAKEHHPPGPKKLPIIGNMHQLLGDQPHVVLGRLSNQFGPIMSLKLGSVPVLVISSADIAREVFKNHDRSFSGRPLTYAAKRIGFDGSDVTFAPYGEYWRQVRKIVILELLSAKRVQSFQAERGRVVQNMLNTIAMSASPVDLSEITMVLANNFVCGITFSKMYQHEDNLKEFLRQIQNMLGGFIVSDFLPRMWWLNKLSGLEANLEKNFELLNTFYDQVIKEHLDPQRPKTEHEDVVDVLLRVQKDPDQRISLTCDQIKGVLTTIFFAGTDTSSATLVWTMTELIRNPSVMKKAQDEVRNIVNKDGIVEETHISKLEYLHLVIKESLRLHPPVPLLVPRETIESCTLVGYEIPAKTRVFFNAKSISTDPNYWENPNEFKPERFLNNPVDFKGLHFEYLPFGAGRRVCPGINFGLQLIELALANLLHRFDWKLPDGLRKEDINMEESFGIAMHKRTALCLVHSAPP